ncbi:hypothetical protein FOCG_04500 [Fusarium oxysporum f. sp. radicis-lycopersici 26381]|uniref:Uncharacterized protein n=2 Tax=Fusarium oxysporum TaxID=5507 RepID=X0IKU3_FUSOX|nr:hypothetical protein FOZG_09638 [Fusarium oxysporum Fo47]EWZ89624.1 hypothetical protein FOWG_07589 [Fusarium oxysporum f. sp. lycopersici MN25]EXL57182.1 hypothetical protein FOCG_04500 [Fusarium oxysporum f. sp. radicis-lycopersici 26381]EXL84560.1 hypothetical protein FOPG_03111 [Fusarium oxysporum f. sp. conglutinans race 2 54008]
MVDAVSMYLGFRLMSTYLLIRARSTRGGKHRYRYVKTVVRTRYDE